MGSPVKQILDVPKKDVLFVARAVFFRVMAALLLLSQQVGFAQSLAAAVQSVQSSSQPAHISNVSYNNGRLTIGMDKDASYKVFTLTHPRRLVVEFSDTAHNSQPYEANVNDSIVKRVRSAQFQSSPTKIARVVLDLKTPASYNIVREGGSVLLSLSQNEGSSDNLEPTMTSTSDHFSNAPITTKADAAHGAAPAFFNDDNRADSVVGEAEFDVTSGATKMTDSPVGAKKKPRDILATLPRTPVTIDFDNADIRDVLRVLAEMSGVNLIHGPDIRNVVTIHLDQVPFDEAFTTILSMNGLVAQQMGGNVLRILTPEDLSSDRSRSVTTYKTYYLNYAKASELTQHLGAVRISPNAKVTIDDRTNAVVVTDTPEGLAAAERLIAELDRKPKQVMIEAKIVEVNLTDNLSLGIRWEYSGLNNREGQYQTVGLREVKAEETVAAGQVGFVGVRNNLETGDPEAITLRSVGPGQRGTGVSLPGPKAQNAAITFGLVNNSQLLTATLDALESKGISKVLSNPKIVTINNQQAKIQVGDKVPYSVSNVAATGVQTQSTQFVDAGIILTVTPTINADNRIRVNVKPEVSVPGENVPGVGPPIRTRTAQTEVLIRDNETLVIGGLIDETISENVSKVPLLGDIPVLGTFFRNRDNQKTRKELLVFITPTIIND